MRIALFILFWCVSIMSFSQGDSTYTDSSYTTFQKGEYMNIDTVIDGKTPYTAWVKSGEKFPYSGTLIDKDIFIFTFSQTKKLAMAAAIQGPTDTLIHHFAEQDIANKALIRNLEKDKEDLKSISEDWRISYNAEIEKNIINLGLMSSKDKIIKAQGLEIKKHKKEKALIIIGGVVVSGAFALIAINN